MCRPIAAGDVASDCISSAAAGAAGVVPLVPLVPLVPPVLERSPRGKGPLGDLCQIGGTSGTCGTGGAPAPAGLILLRRKSGRPTCMCAVLLPSSRGSPLERSCCGCAPGTGLAPTQNVAGCIGCTPRAWSWPWAHTTCLRLRAAGCAPGTGLAPMPQAAGCRLRPWSWPCPHTTCCRLRAAPLELAYLP